MMTLRFILGVVGTTTALLASPWLPASSRVPCATRTGPCFASESNDTQALLDSFFEGGGEITENDDEDDEEDQEEHEHDDDDFLHAVAIGDDDAGARAMLEEFMASGEFEIVDAGEVADDALERALVEESTLRDATPLVTTPIATAPSVLANEGVVRLGRVLSAATVVALREHVLAELDELLHTNAAETPGTSTARFSAVLAPHATDMDVERRWDVRLRLTPLVRRALRELMDGPLGESFEAACGADAELHELAALVAAPGAAPQPLHADTLWNADGCLYTSFVALQTVSREMGPTRFLRSTHTAEAHAAFDDACAPEDVGTFLAGLPSDTAACGLLEAGDATLYDGRLLHGGSASADNAVVPAVSDGVRVLFYVTFKRADADADELGNDEAYSLLSNYRGRFTLRALRERTRSRSVATV